MSLLKQFRKTDKSILESYIYDFDLDPEYPLHLENSILASYKYEPIVSKTKEKLKMFTINETCCNCIYRDRNSYVNCLNHHDRPFAEFSNDCDFFEPDSICKIKIKINNYIKRLKKSK